MLRVMIVDEAAERADVLQQALARFDQFQALKRELDDMEEKLANRKVIERAKGILMQGRNLSEEDAYRALRTQAMQTSARLVTVARQVVALAAFIST